MVVPFGSWNDSTFGRPGIESLRSSAATPCCCSAFFRSAKSASGATSNDSLTQRVCAALMQLDDELAHLGREERALVLAAGERKPDHLRVVLDRLGEVGRLEGGVADAQHFDHDAVPVFTCVYLRPTRSISADMPPWPAPSWISLSYSVDLDRGEIRERLLQQFARVEVLDLGGAAGLVLELLGRIALDQQQPAGLERPLDVAEHPRAQRRRAELKEDRHHHVERLDRPCPCVEIGLFGADRHAALLRQRARLRERGRREVHRQHVEALLGEEDAVAALAVGDRQRPLPALEQMRLALEESVRLRPEVIAGSENRASQRSNSDIAPHRSRQRVRDVAAGGKSQSGQSCPARAKASRARGRSGGFRRARPRC